MSSLDGFLTSLLLKHWFKVGQKTFHFFFKQINLQFYNYTLAGTCKFVLHVAFPSVMLTSSYTLRIKVSKWLKFQVWTDVTKKQDLKLNKQTKPHTEGGLPRCTFIFFSEILKLMWFRDKHRMHLKGYELLIGFSSLGNTEDGMVRWLLCELEIW